MSYKLNLRIKKNINKKFEDIKIVSFFIKSSVRLASSILDIFDPNNLSQMLKSAIKCAFYFHSFFLYFKLVRKQKIFTTSWTFLLISLLRSNSIIPKSHKKAVKNGTCVYVNEKIVKLSFLWSLLALRLKMKLFSFEFSAVLFSSSKC